VIRATLDPLAIAGMEFDRDVRGAGGEEASEQFGDAQAFLWGGKTEGGGYRTDYGGEVLGGCVGEFVDDGPYGGGGGGGVVVSCGGVGGGVACRCGGGGGCICGGYIGLFDDIGFSIENSI